MPRAYSEDLRYKVLEHVAKGTSKTKTAELFGIGANSIYLWQRRLKELGHLKSRYKGKPVMKITGQKLRKYIGKHPDAYLEEIAVHFGASAVGIWKACKRYKITRKKRVGPTKNATGKPGRGSVARSHG